MTDHASLLRTIRVDARPYVEQLLDLKEIFSGFQKLATANGLDWGAVKALLKAEVEDERAEDGTKRVDKIIAKADFATAYADMLGLGSANMNENNCFVDGNGIGHFIPPHDSDGVIIEEQNFDRSTGAAIVTTGESGGWPSSDGSGNADEGREQSEKVEAAGKDCNAHDLAARAVQYPAGRGASSPAPISKETAPVSGDAVSCQDASPTIPIVVAPLHDDAPFVVSASPDIPGAPITDDPGELPAFLDRRKQMEAYTCS